LEGKDGVYAARSEAPDSGEKVMRRLQQAMFKAFKSHKGEMPRQVRVQYLPGSYNVRATSVEDNPERPIINVMLNPFCGIVIIAVKEVGDDHVGRLL
jgi:hypothetical protein